ncbi:MAG: ThuA domain-containing protein [Planctomycetota bacterium]|nr:ThuA domain-containing protein [Planctomycetota bacterium]
MDGVIRTAVVTGKHPYDVPAFQRMWRELPGVDAYPQHLEEFASSPAATRAGYEVLVFFNFHQAIPTGEEVGGGSTKASRLEARLDARIKDAMAALGQTVQGILVLHHALLAWPGWERWSAVCGMADRSFGQVNCDRVRTLVLDADHPVTRGLSGWEMDDEIYEMGPPDQGCRILLGTDHPRSMRALAWVHDLGRSRVFVYQSGHDAKAFSNDSFRRVLASAIAWLAGRT